MAMKTSRSSSSLPDIKSDILGFKSRGQSKVNSRDNEHYVPGGGHAKIFDSKLPKIVAQSKIDDYNDNYIKSRPHSDHSAERKISMNKIKITKNLQDRLRHSRHNFESLEQTDEGIYAVFTQRSIKAKAKVDSFGNASYTPQGGNVTIINNPVAFNANPKVGSLDNAHHIPGGGNFQMTTNRYDLGHVEPKVGSKDNIYYRPQGGNVAIHNQKTNWTKKAKVDDKNTTYTPKGGDQKIQMERIKKYSATPRIEATNKTYRPKPSNVTICDQKLDWKAKAMIGSLENIDYIPGGGDKTIPQQNLQWNADPRVTSLDNIHYQPGGGHRTIINDPIHVTATAKVGSLEQLKTYRPGGGNVQVVNDPMKFDAVTPRIDASNHGYKPRGGNVQITDIHEDWSSTAKSKVETFGNIDYQPGGGTEIIPMLIPAHPAGSVDDIPGRGRSLNTSRSSGVIRN